jgi:hypothetical protein
MIRLKLDTDLGAGMTRSTIFVVRYIPRARIWVGAGMTTVRTIGFGVHTVRHPWSASK